MENRKPWNAPTRMLLESIRIGFLTHSCTSAADRLLIKGRANLGLPVNFAFRLKILDWSVSLIGVLLVAGCGAPGDPVAPSPPIPTAIADLSARQAGDGVQLTFDMPTKTIRGERLVEAPAVEVLRGVVRPDGAPDPNSFQVIDTIPGALIAKYQADDHIQILSPIAPDDTRAHPGATLVYRVRTRAAQKRTSSDSNSVTLHLFPVPARIESLQSKVSETSIDLSWPAVNRTSGGDSAVVSEYRVYRGQLDGRSHDPATKEVLHEKWIAPLSLLATSNAAEYRDTQFDFGKTYVYVVRSVTTASGNALESSDSDPLVLTPADTFPPATPQGTVVAVVVNADRTSNEVDLSWSINSESDLAGYRVYRSERENDMGDLVTAELLLSPAYRDTSVAPGHRYWYRVTAVDRTGNESAPATPVVAEITQHSS